ncbi:MAG: rod shape-determining protein RodA [Pseudomonadota bacterium]
MIDRKFTQNIDWPLLLMVFLLIAIGVVNLYSATFQAEEGKGSPIYLKQIYWAGCGFLFLVIILFFDYHLLLPVAYPLYWISLILLIAVLLFGRPISGSQRWLTLASFSFQPSELVKISLILALAKYFFENDFDRRYTFRDLYIPLGMVLLPALLIMRQPDLGTALLLLLLSISIFLFLGIDWKTLFISIGSLVLSLPLVWFVLKDYQKKRLFTFIQPESDPLGAGYHIIQSKIAVGSGAFWGKGFLKGTQGQLRFLPEQHTDFAFSVLSEEWGFIGSLVVVTLFLLLILTALNIARQSKDRFGLVLALGIGALFFWQSLVNMGMVVGLVPVVGVPLPFISYGGSSIIASLIGVGLLLNIQMRRFIIQS